MPKVKVLKKLPKSRTKIKPTGKISQPKQDTNPYADQYLKFYDDIKIPTKRYDW